MSVIRRVTRSLSLSTHNPENDSDEPSYVNFYKEEVHDLSDGEVPKEEFRGFYVDLEEAAAYLKVKCNLQPPTPEPWVLRRPPSKGKVPKGSSKCAWAFLETIRQFCQVPDDVEFQITREGEYADTPPPDFFTCYKVHLLRFCLWFPISEIIFQFLNSFSVSLSQITPHGLHHLIGILIMRFEREMILDAGYLEGLLAIENTSNNLSYCFNPRKHMRITKGFTSNETNWRDFFFYVCLNSAFILGRVIICF